MNEKTFEELKLSGNLPSPAGVGMKILQITRTEDYSAEEMGEAIMGDSSLTGRILQLANSASNAGHEPTTTVSDAIMRLGGRTVRDLSLAFSLVSERRAGTCKAFDYETYWSLSLARAVSAQVLSRILSFGRPEQAYICGLLGEIGRLALASVYSEKYAELIEETRMGGLEALIERENDELNINHAQVGACMLEEWGLPEVFGEAIEEFCKSRRLSPGPEPIESLAEILRLGDVVASACIAGETTTHREWEILGDQLKIVRGHLGMDPEAFQRFCDTCGKEWVSWGHSLDVSTGDGVTFSAVFASIAAAREAIAEGVEGSTQTVDARMTTPGSAVGEEDEVERFKILAVDDDPVSLKILVGHLRKEGYEVEMARSGNEGLKMALSTSPDIVIADWEMPGMDGLELCRSLRRIDAGANMYFLLLTGREEDELLVEAFDVGTDAFITKPFNPRLLSARIKGGVRLARLHRRIEADKQTMMKQVAELGVMTRKLRATTLTDALTDLHNRRYAMKRLESEWASVIRTGRALSVVMVDIDYFKLVNDNYGHDTGDVVLKETARVVRSATRTTDEVCRLGGEEFLIICRNTNQLECEVVAERVRDLVEANVVKAGGFDKGVTISLGIACTEAGYADITALLKASDEAVYLAKDMGRNQVRLASEVVAKKSA